MAAPWKVRIAPQPRPGLQNNLSITHCRFGSGHVAIASSSRGCRVGWTLVFDRAETVMLTNQQQSRVVFISFSPHLSGMMTASQNASQREPSRSCAACGKACTITRAPPCCERGSGGRTAERESDELLIPCTIGHLNPRQTPYLY